MLLALKIMLSQKIFSCLLPMNITSKVSFISKFPIRNVKDFSQDLFSYNFVMKGKMKIAPENKVAFLSCEESLPIIITRFDFQHCIHTGRIEILGKLRSVFHSLCKYLKSPTITTCFNSL